MVQKGLFSIQNIYLPFVSLLFVPKRLNKEQTMKEFQIFDLNHGLTSLKISNIVDYLKSTFLQFRKVSIDAEAYNVTKFCRLSKINIFIVYCNPLYRKNDNNHQVSEIARNPNNRNFHSKLAQKIRKLIKFIRYTTNVHMQGKASFKRTAF